MNEFFQDSATAGVVISLISYLIGMEAKKRWKLPILNPLLISIVLVIGFLLIFKVVPIGKPLMLSPAFPPASTGHATFTASGAPSSIVSAVIHTHSFTLAKSVCYDLH